MGKKIVSALAFLAFALAFGSTALANSCTGGTVNWFAEDTITKGDWYFNPVGSPIGVYGSYAYILPNPPTNYDEINIGPFSTPIGFDFSNSTSWWILQSPPYNFTWEQVLGLGFYKPDPPYWDEYWSQVPNVTYYVNGTRYIPNPIYNTSYVQYPVFEWAWNTMHSFVSGQDPREAYYPQLGQWRLACWDDGNERCGPFHGYMNFTMFFPEGRYLLSLYAYDYEMFSRDSQEYRIYDTEGNLLASKQISGQSFDEGVFEDFEVIAPECGFTIVVQVYNDAGHVPFGYPYPEDRTNNILLSGIFVDKITEHKAPALSPLLMATLMVALAFVGVKRIKV